MIAGPEFTTGSTLAWLHRTGVTDSRQTVAVSAVQSALDFEHRQRAV